MPEASKATLPSASNAPYQVFIKKGYKRDSACRPPHGAALFTARAEQTMMPKTRRICHAPHRNRSSYAGLSAVPAGSPGILSVVRAPSVGLFFGYRPWVRALVVRAITRLRSAATAKRHKPVCAPGSGMASNRNHAKRSWWMLRRPQETVWYLA